MAKVIRCEDGAVIRGETDEELLANAQQHIRDAHDVRVSVPHVVHGPAELLTSTADSNRVELLPLEDPRSN